MSASDKQPEARAVELSSQGLDARSILESLLFFISQQRRILTIGLLLGLLFGLAAYLVTPTSYETKGTFMVDQLPFSIAQSSTDAETERQLVQTLIMSIATEDMQQALKQKIAVPGMRLAFTDREPKVKLSTPHSANIKITSAKNSRIAVITAFSADPVFGATVINTIFSELEIFNQIAGQLAVIQSQLKLDRARAERLVNELVTTSGERIKLEKENQQLNDYLSKGESVVTFPAFASDATLNNLKTQLMLVSSEYQAIAVNSTRGQRLESKQAEMKSLEYQTTLYANNLAAALKSSFDITSTREAGLHTDFENLNRVILDSEKRRTELTKGFSDYQQRVKLTQALDPLQQASVIVIIDRAHPAPRAAGPSLPLDLVLGLIFGLGLGGGSGLLLHVLDNRLRSPSQIQIYTGAPCLATLPNPPHLSHGRGALDASGDDPYYSQMGFLRSDMLRAFMAENHQTIFPITPVNSQIDISDAVAALAVALAKAEKRTLVVDLNLRNPCMGKKLGIEPKTGLVDWLYSEDELDSFITYSAVRELALLDPGIMQDDADDLFTRRSLSPALIKARKDWDFILVAGPPLLEVWHLLLSVPARSPLIIVAEYMNSKISDVRQVAAQARASDLDVYGVIIQGYSSDKEPSLKSLPLAGKLIGFLEKIRVLIKTITRRRIK